MTSLTYQKHECQINQSFKLFETILSDQRLGEAVHPEIWEKNGRTINARLTNKLKTERKKKIVFGPKRKLTFCRRVSSPVWAGVSLSKAEMSPCRCLKFRLQNTRDRSSHLTDSTMLPVKHCDVDNKLVRGQPANLATRLSLLFLPCLRGERPWQRHMGAIKKICQVCGVA